MDAIDWDDVAEETSIEDDDFIEKLFQKVDKESKEVIAKLTQNAKQRAPMNATSNANVLKLREVCLLKKWDRLNDYADVRTRMEQEPNVIRTHYLTQAELELPYEMREVTTARFFLYAFKQEGLFNDIANMDVFTLELTGQQLLLISTMSRRIDEHSLLTGNYVFQLVENTKPWTKQTIENKGKMEEGVCKIMYDGPKVLTEKVIFRNFYFDILKQDAREPLISLNFL